MSDETQRRENVWSFPRPPGLEPVSAELVVQLDGVDVARTRAGYRVLETSHPPVYYFPPEDVSPDLVQPANGGSFCEWKGRAAYFSVVSPTRTLHRVAWAYEDPTAAFRPIAGYLAFYPTSLECYVDGERVEPQPGGFYGGWITKNLDGPFKGGPGSAGW